MALNTVTLKWSIPDLIQSGLSGTLTITPSAEMSDTTDHELIPVYPRSVSFSGGTGQLAGIVGNDDAQILPAGTGYVISVVAENGQTIVAPFTTQILFATGAIQWLDQLATVPVVSTSFQYLPLPSGTPASGQVPVATGTGEASAWTTLAAASTPLAADQNLLAWSYDQAAGALNTSVPASGTVQLVRVILRAAATVTNVIAHVGVLGTGFTANENFAGLYTSGGTLLSATADQASAWGSAGLKTMALASQQVGLAAGIYYVALVQNGSANVAFARAGGLSGEANLLNAGLTASTARFATGPVSQASLPSPITMTSNTLASVGFWAALS